MMIVRLFGNKLKFCRLYDDDVFGNLSLRPKKSQKLLNIIFNDVAKKDKRYKKIQKFLNFFLYRIRKFIYINLRRRIKRRKFLLQRLLFLNLSKKYFFFNLVRYIFKKEVCLNFFLFYYVLKCILKQIQKYGFNFKVQKSSQDKFNFFNFNFNFRVDEGKPKRKRKKITLYCERLLTRHKLRFFCGRMSVRQFRSYVKKQRNSKHFGMLFVWFLESRIDTILYRLNIHASSMQNRQFIKHFGVFVNNVFVNIPSFRLTFKDFLTFKEKRKIFRYILLKFYKKLIFTSLPYYYEINYRIMTMIFFFKPINSIIFFPFCVDMQRLGCLGERF